MITLGDEKFDENIIFEYFRRFVYFALNKRVCVFEHQFVEIKWLHVIVVGFEKKKTHLTHKNLVVNRIYVYDFVYIIF